MIQKLAYLDSLRGLACLVVLFAHTIATFYPHAIFGQLYEPISDWEACMHWPPLSLLSAGHFAVCLFFILSGYVLSIRFLCGSAKPGELAQAAVKRPTRLGGLVVFSILVGYALMCLGWMKASPSAEQPLPWLQTYWQSPPSLADFMRDLLLRPFKSGVVYNAPLWTIYMELKGSYLVFFYVAIAWRLPAACRWGLLGLCTYYTFGSLYIGFVIGLAFAEWQRSVSRFRLREPSLFDGAARHPGAFRRAWMNLTGGELRPLVGCCVLSAGLLLGSYMHYYQPRPAVQADGWMRTVGAHWHRFGTGGYSMTGAMLTFAAVLMTPRIQSALSGRVLGYLGKISYAVYAFHFILIGALAQHLHGWLVAPLGWHVASLLSATITFACLILVAELATRWVDRPSIRLGNALARTLYEALVGQGSKAWALLAQEMRAKAMASFPRESASPVAPNVPDLAARNRKAA